MVVVVEMVVVVVIVLVVVMVLNRCNCFNGYGMEFEVIS